MRIGRLIAGAALLITLPLLSACGSSGSSSGGSTADAPTPGVTIGAQPAGGADLAGTSWQLSSGPFTATELPAAGITLEFADGTASGSAGVNRYTGGYTSTTEGTLSFDPMAVTAMAGTPEAMKLEQEYLTALQQTFGYTEGSGTLTLFGVADQVMVFTAAS